MARKIVRLPSLSNVTPGATATLEIPRGPTYLNLILSATGTALAASHFEEINVYIDGKGVMRFSNLQRLMDLNSYYNRGTDTVNEFVLHFFRAELMDAVYRRLPGIGTSDVQTFHVEFKLASGAPSDITMTAHAQIDPMPQPLGAMVKVREIPFSSAVSGEVEIDKLVRGPWYAAIHLFKADVSAVEVQANQVKIVDATKDVMERTQEEASPVKRVPVTAKATHVDFITEGDLQQALKTSGLTDFRLKATLDTSGSMDIVTETLDTLEGA